MSLEKEFQVIIESLVDEKLQEFETRLFLLKPFFLTETIAKEFDGKSVRWVRDTFCNQEFVDKGLVKKIGNEWHFRNPEFLNFVHDEWWEGK